MSDQAGLRELTPTLSKARKRVLKANPGKADRFAANVLSSGVESLRGVARALRTRGIKAARGGEWSAVQEATLPETDTTHVTCLTSVFSRRSGSILTRMGARRLRNVGSKALSAM